MGGGIGQWLLFRAADRALSLFSLVVPPGAMTPVHDHLAWGLVGLYRGNQDEEFYRPRSGRLELERRRPLSPGGFYALLPRGTTSIASAPPRRSPRSRSTCSRMTLAVCCAIPTTRRPERRARFAPATSTRSARRRSPSTRVTHFMASHPIVTFVVRGQVQPSQRGPRSVRDRVVTMVTLVVRSGSLAFGRV